MPSNYPTALDDFLDPAAGSTLANPPHHTQHGDLNDAVEAIEAELGLTPSGASATVAARLDASEVLRGSAFPAQPAYGNNRPYYRTDLNMSYFYDGTRWLSSTLYHVASNFYDAQAVTFTAYLSMPSLNGSSDLWLVSNMTRFYVQGGTALGASHKWVGELRRYNSATGIETDSLASGASDTWRGLETLIGAVTGSADQVFQWDWIKTGTPGTLYVQSRLTYRLVAT